MADLKGYWQELAKAQGLSEEETAAVLQALGNEKVAKAFQSGFVERPVFSSELDKTRNEWKSKVDQYDNWYKTTALPSVQKAQEAAELLGKYQQTYGTLDGTTEFKAATGMTQEQITKILDERDAQRNQAYMKVTKTLTRAATNHLKQFGEELDMDAFETFAVNRGGDPMDAYNAFIQPKVQERSAQAEVKRQQEMDDRLKAAREEGARDALSKRGLPQEVKTEPSMLRKYMDTPREKLSDSSGRAAFMEEWNKGSAASSLSQQSPRKGAGVARGRIRSDNSLNASLRPRNTEAG